MLLAIDVGNTHTVIGLFEDGTLRFRWRIASDSRRTADEFGILTRELCGQSGVALDDVTGVILCSVVPALTSAVAEMAERVLGVDPVVVGPDLDLGITIEYFEPAEVGPDRLANAVAVHETVDGPSIVVDFGTATTFDAVTADGCYLGGVIAPGLITSAENLFRRGALLPRVAVTTPPSVMGRSTEEAMRSGIVFGAVGQVDEIVRRMVAEWGVKSPRVIATGGLAELIAGLSSTIESVEPDLTLVGLAEIYRRVRG
ncbi:MAG: type III pantothenate kinase [Candidatus Eisenbacteria bacterium]|nr:type III pantothenate kinase [Candidatus Eisenbacteria bacterium]